MLSIRKMQVQSARETSEHHPAPLLEPLQDQNGNPPTLTARSLQVWCQSFRSWLGSSSPVGKWEREGGMTRCIKQGSGGEEVPVDVSLPKGPSHSFISPLSSWQHLQLLRRWKPSPSQPCPLALPAWCPSFSVSAPARGGSNSQEVFSRGREENICKE